MNIINFFKPWEYSKLIIIIYTIIMYIAIKKNKIKIIIILNLIYLTIHTKFDFFSQHIIYIDKIQEIIISHIIPITISYFININIKINKIIFFYKIYEYINYTIIIVNQLTIIPLLNFYIMLNYISYKIKNYFKLIINILYWVIIINNKIKSNKIKYIIILNIKILISIINGNYIYFKIKEIYNIYKICGKINKTKFIKEQQISGLIEWITKSMMLLINIFIKK